MNDPRASRAAVGLALEVPALLLALQGGLVGAFGLLLALLALSAARLSDRPPIEGLPAVGVHLAGLALALGGGFILLPDRPLGPLWTLAFLGLAAPRLAWRLTPRARHLVLLFGLLALIGMAKAIPRLWFGVGTAAYLGAGTLAILTADAGNPALRRHLGALLPLLAAFGFAALMLTGLGWGLPAAEPAVVRALSPWFSAESRRSGFSEGDIELGQISEIIASDLVVLRVHGGVDHLRGQVYSIYNYGNWKRRAGGGTDGPRALEDGEIILDSRVRGTAVRIEAEPEAGPPLFSPMGTRRVSGAPEGSWADGYGLVHVPPAFRTEPRTWTLEYTEDPPPPLDPPQDFDRDLPRRDGPRFRALATAWAGQHATPLDQIDALRRRLIADYRYSLVLTPAPQGADPILFFLEQDRRGHCELFAGALVLLARGLDIPARLVAGYRVFEHNPDGGWFIVRQRDAHAWAEVWLDGAWRTVDPTPPGSLEGEHLTPPSWWANQWDRIKRLARLAFERLAALHLTELVLILITIATLIGLLVLLRRRRERRMRGGAWVSAPVFAPLARLETALDRLEARAAHETLARYAQRLREAGHREPADLVEACAAWLYGGQGDPEALAQDIQRWLAQR